MITNVKIDKKKREKYAFQYYLVPFYFIKIEANVIIKNNTYFVGKLRTWIFLRWDDQRTVVMDWQGTTLLHLNVKDKWLVM